MSSVTFPKVSGVESGAIILSSSGTQYSHTGDTNETNLKVVTVPAGAMGANGIIRIFSFWTYSNNANAKTLRIDVGGTNYMSSGRTTGGWWQQFTMFANDNDETAQKGISASIDGFGNAGSGVTSAIDTTVDFNISFTGQLGNGADTVSLESYTIELL